MSRYSRFENRLAASGNAVYSLMDISYDPAKDAANIQSRGIPLAFGGLVIEHAVGVVDDTRRDYGEQRLKAFAEINGVCFACAYTMRGDVYHIITLRRVREKEVKRWLRGL